MMQMANALESLGAHPAFQAAQLMKHDAAAQINVAAETELDRRSVSAMLVPEVFGGTRPTLPHLMLTLREIGRHDLALGLGSCLTALMAATNVWLAGNEAQNRRFGEILCRGGRISIAYHELAHGNDLQSVQLAAVPTGGSYRLTGVKEVINNIDRAAGVVLFARTGGTNPNRAHSIFFLEQHHLRGFGVEVTKRHDPVGVRGCHISGIRFDNHEIPDSCRLGIQGAGLEYALRAFQVTRTLLPGTSLGAIAAAHRVVTKFALGRELYGMSMSSLPLVRNTLMETAGELWAADCLTTMLAACLHIAPKSMQVYGALGKYLIPKMMKDVLRRLAETLGARSYLRGGEYGMVEKIVRDYPVVSFGHAGQLLCQATVVPFLPRVLGSHGDGLRLADLDDLEQLSPFCPQALQLGMPAGDPLLDSLPRLVALLQSNAGTHVGPFSVLYCSAASALIIERTRLAATLSPSTSAAAGEDVRRYGLMLLATAVLIRRMTNAACADSVTDLLTLTALNAVLGRLGLDQLANACGRVEFSGACLETAILAHLTELSHNNTDLI